VSRDDAQVGSQAASVCQSDRGASRAIVAAWAWRMTLHKSLDSTCATDEQYAIGLLGALLSTGDDTVAIDHESLAGQTTLRANVVAARVLGVAERAAWFIAACTVSQPRVVDPAEFLTLAERAVHFMATRPHAEGAGHPRFDEPWRLAGAVLGGLHAYVADALHTQLPRDAGLPAWRGHCFRRSTEEACEKA
jgi:hypothetical protein